MSIRVMALHDVVEVHAIAQQTFPHAWSIKQFEAELTHPHAHHWVLTQDEKVQAFLCTRIFAPDAEIVSVATHPEHQRRGWARRLLEHFIQVAKVQGVSNVYLEVRVSNGPAQALYHALGFKPLAVRRGYYADNGEDAQVFSVMLGTSATL